MKSNLCNQLILLPGLLCDKEVWEHQMTHLSDIAEIIVPDLSKAETPTAMVEAVLNVAPQSFALAGHSMGGWVALEVAKKCPKQIRKLCLLNTTADADSPEKMAARTAMLTQAEQGQIETIADQLSILFTFNTTVRQQIKQMFIRNADAFIHQQKAMIARQSCLLFLPLIQCPTLVIHARHDKAFSIDHSERILQGIPQSKLAIIEESGHMVTLEVPQAVTTLMRFWLMYF
jgi:pimeloyl-ACP methyl ester carboxylesterase